MEPDKQLFPHPIHPALTVIFCRLILSRQFVNLSLRPFRHNVVLTFSFVLNLKLWRLQRVFM